MRRVDLMIRIRRVCSTELRRDAGGAAKIHENVCVVFMIPASLSIRLLWVRATPNGTMSTHKNNQALRRHDALVKGQRHRLIFRNRARATDDCDCQHRANERNYGTGRTSVRDYGYSKFSSVNE